MRTPTLKSLLFPQTSAVTSTVNCTGQPKTLNPPDAGLMLLLTDVNWCKLYLESKSSGLTFWEMLVFLSRMKWEDWYHFLVVFMKQLAKLSLEKWLKRDFVQDYLYFFQQTLFRKSLHLTNGVWHHTTTKLHFFVQIKQINNNTLISDRCTSSELVLVSVQRRFHLQTL